MKSMLRLSLLTGITLTAAISASFAADKSTADNWPQWRGPLASGFAPGGNPPSEWSEQKNVQWKVKLPGAGSSTPVIWGDKVFVTTAINTGKKAVAPAAEAPPAGKDGPPGGGRKGGFGGGQKPTDIHQFVLLCLDRATGKTLWQKVLREEVPHEGHHRDGTFAAGSPVTDGEHIIAFFGSRGLFCLDLQGNVKWEKQLGKMQTKNSFGEGSSPALHGNTLVVNWDHEGGSFIVAFEKRDGRELWRVPRDERTSWSTPLIVDVKGQPQAIVNATGRVRSYDLATGKVIWDCSGLTDNAIPSPVAGHGRVYAMSGFRGSKLEAITLGRTGNLDGTDAIAWSQARGTPYVPSPLLYGDRLYFLKVNDAQFSAFNAKEGKQLYGEERLTGINGVYASPVGAAGRVYIVGRDGGTVVLKDADQIEVLATNKLDDGIDASPAIAGKQLFLRGRSSLYCLAEQ